jgi:hypothetical protein
MKQGIALGVRLKNYMIFQRKNRLALFKTVAA